MPRWSWILDPGTGGLATMSTAARRLPDSSTATAIDYRRPSCRFCGDRWYLIPWRGGDMIPSRRLTSEHPPRRRVVLWTRGHEAGSFACLVSCPPCVLSSSHLLSRPKRSASSGAAPSRPRPSIDIWHYDNLAAPSAGQDIALVSRLKPEDQEIGMDKW